MVQVRYQYDGSAIILFKQINALLSIAAPLCCMPILYIGSVHLLWTVYLSGGCSPHPVYYYTGSVHLLCSTYLLWGYSPHPNLAVRRVSITYALSRTLLRQQEGVSHLSLLQATQAHPLFLVARVCRRAAARYDLIAENRNMNPNLIDLSFLFIKRL